VSPAIIIPRHRLWYIFGNVVYETTVVFIYVCLIHIESRDIAAGIATGYGLDDEGSEFESWWGKELSFLHIVQTGSYPIGIGDCTGVNAAGR
jgi:hypothetical protein